MPTIVREDGFEIKVLLPPREHGPAHVHVQNANGETKVRLSSLMPYDVSRGMKPSEVVAAVRLVEKHLAQLKAAWRKYHGKP